MSKLFNQHKNNQQGIVLVMALIILTVVLVSALILSQILLNEIKMSININNATVSFYAAESGVEKSLYYIKYSRQENDFSYFTNLSDATDDNNIYDLDNGQSVTIAVATTTAAEFYQYNITTSSPAHVNIIDPAGDIDTIYWGADIYHEYRVHWELEDCFPDKHKHRLEVTAASFADNFSNPEVETHLITCYCSYDSDQCFDAVNRFNAYSNRYYRFSFRPLDSTIKQLSFDIEAGGIGILSEAEIETYGHYKNSQYYIKVHVPSLSPVSDIFDYVIFSEEELRKDL